jgi:hypothetical protein
VKLLDQTIALVCAVFVRHKTDGPELETIGVSVCGFKDIWVFESGSSIAHTRRNQGVLWSKALDVLTTHLYYQELDPEKVKIDILPLNIFQTIKLLLKEGEERQLANELSDIYPSGISKTELIFTLDHM